MRIPKIAHEEIINISTADKFAEMEAKFIFYDNALSEIRRENATIENIINGIEKSIAPDKTAYTSKTPTSSANSVSALLRVHLLRVHLLRVHLLRVHLLRVHLLRVHLLRVHLLRVHLLRVLTYLLILFIPMWDIRPQYLFSTDDGLKQSPELHP